MSPADPTKTSFEFYRALATLHARGGVEASLVTLLFRLLTEVEALREALSSPETPQSVRDAYRAAYERIAVLSHNAAGPSGGEEKILRRFVPREGAEFSPELDMLKRLGATAEEQQALKAKMDEVEMYT